VVNAHYQKGTRAERIVRARLEARGWHVLRRWGSKGSYDLLAIAPVVTARLSAPGGQVREAAQPVLFVEVKNGPRAAMTPESRERLIEEAIRYGAVPLKAHYARKVPGVIEWTDLLTGEPVPEPRAWR